MGLPRKTHDKARDQIDTNKLSPRLKRELITKLDGRVRIDISKKLSEKQKKFKSLLLNNLKLKKPVPEWQLCIQAGYSVSTAAHKVNDIKQSLDMPEAFKRIGFTSDSKVVKLIDLTNAHKPITHRGQITDYVPDNEIRLKAINLACQLSGDFPDRGTGQPGTNLNIGSIVLMWEGDNKDTNKEEQVNNDKAIDAEVEINDCGTIDKQVPLKNNEDLLSDSSENSAIVETVKL